MYQWDYECFSGKEYKFLLASSTGKYHNICNETVKLLEALGGSGKHIPGIEKRSTIELANVEYSLIY